MYDLKNMFSYVIHTQLCIMYIVILITDTQETGLVVNKLALYAEEKPWFLGKTGMNLIHVQLNF